MEDLAVIVREAKTHSAKLGIDDRDNHAFNRLSDNDDSSIV